jgi:Ca-activated chloride channel family protein
MTFRAPAMLWLLAVVPFAWLWLAAHERQRERAARQFMSERLRGVANPARSLRPHLLAAALALIAIAIAGPQFGYTIMPIDTTQTNRVLVIDVSQSMAARDVGASRLDAAKAIAKRIVDADPGRVGLVLFEADADIVSPLTTDGDAIDALLDSIQPGDLSEPGSDFGNALRVAQKLIDSDPAQKADMVLISDGEDQGAHLPDSIRSLRTRNTAVTTIAIGTPDGGPIPQENETLLKDASGDPIITKAHPEVLEQLAKATGGRFFNNPFAAGALDALTASERSGVTRKRDVHVPVDRFQWPLALAFLALLCGSIVNRGAE